MRALILLAKAATKTTQQTSKCFGILREQPAENQNY
ncbi:hypothetical protein FHW00_004476 [Ochrobactrum sp. P6BSIII]|nr:hypothetical protein [Ochrobactrum sp. P6BSIII]